MRKFRDAKGRDVNKATDTAMIYNNDTKLNTHFRMTQQATATSRLGSKQKFSESGILSTYQLQTLAVHKYSASGKSLLEPYMQKFWTWLTEQIPTTISPNAITLAGLIANVATTLIIAWYSPNAQNEIPSWAMVLCAAGLFFYQTMDAIDGKQARRTNSSSPLGELFDHGCDSVSLVFVSLALCISLGLGTHPQLMFYSLFLAVFTFYAAHWQAYVCGTLRFNKVDVTEGQFAAIIIYLVTAMFGCSVWDTQFPLLNIPLKMLPVIGITLGSVTSGWAYFNTIFTGGVGRNGATCADTSVLSPVIPIGIAILQALYISQSSEHEILEENPVLYCLAFGLICAKVTNSLVIAHMTKSELSMFDSALYAPLLLLLNLYIGLPEIYLLWFVLLYSTYDLTWYSVLACREISQYLGISCFKISVFQPPSHQNSLAEKNSYNHKPSKNVRKSYRS